MARCPFAIWRAISGVRSNAYTGGPWRIIHHTTEGSTAQGAFAAYASKKVAPHFTVDRNSIWQHFDTSRSSSAVLNRSGGVETNRLSAVQIEWVGFAGQAKPRLLLENVARLCRWIEAEHEIPQRWPAGPPKGRGGPHNRSISTWKTQGGHYGHSQVPENTHWDPGLLSIKEMEILMAERAAILVVNGTPQPTIKCKIEQGNTWIDLSDWCEYADYARPTYEPTTNQVSMSTEKQIE